jgi:predicted PurR-regulated permease PerM
VFAFMDSPDVARHVARVTGDPRPPSEQAGEALRQAASPLAQQIGAMVGSGLGNVGGILLRALIFFVTLATLLHSGRDLADWTRRIAPIAPTYLERVWDRLSRFARAFVLAAFVVAVTQGSLAYVGYAAGGVDRAAVWAVVTAVLSVVPVFGTSLVWIPLALIQWAQGDTTGALVIVAWSVVIVGTADNIVRPLVIGSAAQLHPLLVFLAVFGGLLTLGVSGLLVGPMLVATLLALLSLHEEERSASGA